VDLVAVLDKEVVALEIVASDRAHWARRSEPAKLEFGTLFANLDHPGATELNRLTDLRLRGESPEEMDDVVQAFTDHGLMPNVIYDFTSEPAHLPKLLDEAGFRTRMGIEVAMVKAGPSEVPKNREVSVGRVSGDRLKVWCDVAESRSPEPLRRARRDIYPELASSGAEEFYLAWLEDHPVGAASLGWHEGTARIGRLEVDPSYADRRVAATLVEHLVRRAEGHILYLFTDSRRARRLYRRLGFEPIYVQHQFRRNV
jgi:ribosomal protein S18 acetylase RimI-like enzyme